MIHRHRRRNIPSERSRSWLTTLLLSVAFAVSLLSQLPQTRGVQGVKLAVYAVWVLALAFGATSAFDVSFSPALVIFVFVSGAVFLYSGLADGLGTGQYSTVSLLAPLGISVLVLAVGYLTAHSLGEFHLRVLAACYVAVTAFVLLVIFRQTFQGVALVEIQGYMYGSKNSIGSIALSSMILLWTLSRTRHDLWLKATYMLGVILFITAIRNRASMVALPVIGLVALLTSRASKRAIVMGVALAILIGAIAFEQSMVREYLFGAFTSGKDVTNIDALSAGRLAQYEPAWKLFVQNPLIGVGRYYVEAFPLSALVQLGSMGGLPVIVLGYLPLMYAAMGKKREAGTDRALLLLALSYAINSLFEEQAPFGPGVKCFILWFIFGNWLYWQSMRPPTEGSISKGIA